MKYIYVAFFIPFLSILLPSCDSSKPIGQNTANSANTANQPVANPLWPSPEWQSDPSAAIENATAVVFKAEKLTEMTLSVPADWVKLGNKPSLLLYKTPTVGDNLFGNLLIQSSNTKPDPMYPANPKKNFDYSGFEPDAAFKHFFEKKKEEPSTGRLQQIAIDGVWGVLEQVLVTDAPSANKPAKEPTAIWQWTTFIRSKIENNKVEIVMSYPSSEIEKYSRQIAGLVNSVKIKRMPDVVLLESKPQ